MAIWVSKVGNSRHPVRRRVLIAAIYLLILAVLIAGIVMEMILSRL